MFLNGSIGWVQVNEIIDIIWYVGAGAPTEDDINQEKQRLISQILDLQNTLDGEWCLTFY